MSLVVSTKDIDDVVVQFLTNCPDLNPLDDEEYCAKVSEIAEKFNIENQKIEMELSVLKPETDDSDELLLQKKEATKKLKKRKYQVDENKLVGHCEIYFDSMFTFIKEINEAQMKLFYAAVRFASNFPLPFSSNTKKSFTQCLVAFETLVHAKYFRYHSHRMLLTMPFKDESMRKYHIEQNKKAYARFNLGKWPEKTEPHYNSLHPFLHRLNNTNYNTVTRQVNFLKSFTLGVLYSPFFEKAVAKLSTANAVVADTVLNDDDVEETVDKIKMSAVDPVDMFDPPKESGFDASNQLNEDDGLETIGDQLFDMGIDQAPSSQDLTKDFSSTDKEIFHNLLINIFKNAGETVVKLKRMKTKDTNEYVLKLQKYGSAVLNKDSSSGKGGGIVSSGRLSSSRDKGKKKEDEDGEW
jgi:hypothetical protein